MNKRERGGIGYSEMVQIGVIIIIGVFIMGIIDHLFSTQAENIHEAWEVVSSTEQFEEALDRSYRQPVVIFKHSIRCGISAMAKHQLERDWDLEEGEAKMYYLDLINHRQISNLIAEKLGVVHQSPQIILLKNGQATYHTSHHMISVAALKQAL